MQFPLLPVDRRVGQLFPDRVFANGGRLRDHFAAEIHGTPPAAAKDFDYVLVATGLAEAEERLRELGTVTLTAGHFPVIKVRTEERLDLDVALARRETSTGTGHRDFTVDFGPEVTIEDDAVRRDFTVNMLSASCSTGRVYAPHGAMDDIARRIVRVIGPDTFRDDPLRMLRAAQFASRLGFSVERGTMEQMQRDAHLATTVDGERISEEMRKMLVKSERPSEGFRVLARSGVLWHVLPEVGEGIGCEQNVHHRHDVFDHNMAALDYSKQQGGDIVDLWAAVLHDVGKPRTQAARPDGTGYSFHGHETVGADIVRGVFSRLRESNERTSDVANLVAEHMFAVRTSDGQALTDSAVRRFLRKVTRGTEEAELARSRVERQFLLRLCDRAGSGRSLDERAEENRSFEERARRILSERPAMNVSALAIDGRDVIAAAVRSGARPEGYRGDRLVGETLAHLLEVVTDHPELNERTRLEAIVHESLTSRSTKQNTTERSRPAQHERDLVARGTEAARVR